MRRQHDPLRLGRWLLRLRAGAARAAETEPDLIELFRQRAAARGRLYAEWRWLADAASVGRPRAPAARRSPRMTVMDALWQDVRVGLRSLLAERRFTVIAVLGLSLGVGMTTAVFSVVNAVLLRPLPYANPDRLVAVTSLFKSQARTTTSSLVRLTDVARWREQPLPFESIGAFAYTQLPMRVGDLSYSPVTALMDPEFLPTLGYPLALGNFFDRAAATGSDTTVIISHALWTDVFDRDPRVVGRTVFVDGAPFVVRGVLATGFQFPRSDASYYSTPVELLIPSASFSGFPAAARQWFGIARLRPGVSITQAEAELQGIAEGLLTGESTSGTWSVQLASLSDATTRRARQPLLVLLAIAIVLLIIAATNLMNLYFARGVARLKEMSIRRAIGSTTGRLVRLLLVESLLLAVAGGIGGVWLAALAIRTIVALSPVHLPVTAAIDLDPTVLTFTLVACVGAALAVGLLPALHVSAKADEAARSSGMRTSASRGVARLQQALCVVQTALGMVLLASAGLLAHSLWALERVEPGFERERVLGFNMSVPSDVTPAERVLFYARALEEVRSIPGVERAGLISFLPPETRAGVFMGIAVEGGPHTASDAPPRTVNTLISSPEYFDAVGMPIVRGRGLTNADRGDAPPAIVVNEAFVRAHLGDGDPIGRRIGTQFDRLEPVRQIVGVVKDAHDRGVAVAPYPIVYVPFTQFSLPYGSIAVRTALPAASVVPVIRDRLTRLNSAVPLTGFQRLDERLYTSLREPRFYTLLAVTCASLAVLFVTVGLYGLVSYSVGRRTPELGIRLAVGAQRGAILRMVLHQGLRLALAGVGLGAGLAWLSARALEPLLFQVEARDPLTFTAAAATLVLVTLAATYGPARRASRLDPIAALRGE